MGEHRRLFVQTVHHLQVVLHDVTAVPNPKSTTFTCDARKPPRISTRPPSHNRHPPEHPVAVIELGDVLLPVVVVARLPDRDKGVLPPGRVAFPYPVVARHVPRVNSGVVGGLDPARSFGAPLQKAVAVSAGVELAPVRPLRGVAVPDLGIAQAQELVGYFEFETVPGCLR